MKSTAAALAAAALLGGFADYPPPRHPKPKAKINPKATKQKAQRRARKRRSK